MIFEETAMKKSRFPGSRIIGALKEAYADILVAEPYQLAQQRGIHGRMPVWNPTTT